MALFVPASLQSVRRLSSSVWHISMDENHKGKYMNWYLEALKKYAVFSGRARRKEYWSFFLFNMIVTIA
ncbi:MAG: hypothetical protein ACI9JR_003037, partial [Gammaproteobacteria bacterium]